VGSNLVSSIQYLKRKKIQVAKWGTPKKYLKKYYVEMFMLQSIFYVVQVATSHLRMQKIHGQELISSTFYTLILRQYFVDKNYIAVFWV